MNLGPSPRVFKELGPTKGLPSANWGVHTSMLFSLPSFQGRFMSGGRGDVRLARGNSQALPRALNLGAIAENQGSTTVELW